MIPLMEQYFLRYKLSIDQNMTSSWLPKPVFVLRIHRTLNLMYIAGFRQRPDMRQPLKHCHNCKWVYRDTDLHVEEFALEQQWSLAPSRPVEGGGCTVTPGWTDLELSRKHCQSGSWGRGIVLQPSISPSTISSSVFIDIRILLQAAWHA